MKEKNSYLQQKILNASYDMIINDISDDMMSYITLYIQDVYNAELKEKEKESLRQQRIIEERDKKLNILLS
jgi:hypothetical protein